MIQIRNVPEELHRKLKARAALEGMSLSDYLLAQMRSIAERATLREIKERVSRRRPVRLQASTAEMVRQERERR